MAISRDSVGRFLRRWPRCLRWSPLALALGAGVSARAQAQGEVVGRVLADSGRTPVRNATLGIGGQTRTVTTDSLGRFRLADVPPGDHVLVVRAMGFQEARLEFFVESNESVFKDVALVRAAQRLAGTTILAPGATEPGASRMAPFKERMTLGIGHFITRATLADAEGGRRSTGDLLSMSPGVTVKRGTSRAWIATGRAVNPAGGCAFCRPKRLNVADEAAGARPACYMDVYLDGALVFNSTQPEAGLFDVNSIPPDQLEGVEVYTSTAQVPAQYNRTGGGCGVLLLWTRA